MKIFIIGPTILHKDQNIETFKSAAHEIKIRQPPEEAWTVSEDGYEVLLPHNNGVGESDHWKAHLRANIAIIASCDAACILPGSQTSERCVREIKVAQQLGLVVKTLELSMLDPIYADRYKERVSK